MGEVYLARDTQLERTVALKILPAAIASDQQRMRRFIQEAKAASSLNHQNIITIYEIGEADSTHFIATEFIDGATLRQHIKETRMTVSEALDVAIQIASALAAAHEAGIIHRDMKPENVMLRTRDSFVKVLDFGLIKLIEPQSGKIETEAPTRPLINTDAGTILGTVGYMSPEQARGKSVDARTDIWSFGVILYEMLTGHAPFSGETATDVLASIVKTEPPPLTRYAPEAPAKLEEIVTKALEKDREERYQTAKDLLVDLRRLKKRLEVEAELERSSPPAARDEIQTPISGGSTPDKTQGDPAVSTNEVGGAAPASSAEYIVSEIKRHKAGATFIIAALVIVLAGLGYGLYRFTAQRQPTSPTQAMKIVRLTTTGNINWGAISPDGKYIVYSLIDERGQQSVWVKHVATSSSVQVVPPSENSYQRFTFTRDGSYIYFRKTEKGGLSSLYRMPALGGAAQKVVENALSRAALSPDEKRLAFIRGLPAQRTSLVLANSDGSEEQTLVTRKSPDYFFFGGIDWSPDGKSITCVVGKSPTAAGSAGTSPRAAGTLINVPVAGGAETPVMTPKWIAILSIEWLSDGSGLIVIAREQPSFPVQVWRLSYPSGEAQRITNDFNNYLGVSLTADATALVTLQHEATSHIWIAPEADVNRAKEITTGTGREDGAVNISWTPDGNIVYESTASGSRHIWIMNMDGSDQRQLTEGNHDNQAQDVSPDGRYLVFTSNRTGVFHLWRMNIDGSNLKQLTNGPGELYPFFSPDGRWVLFSDPSLSWWKVPADGGEPAQLSSTGLRAGVSPDGKFVAYVRTDGPGLGPQFNISIVPLEGGPTIKSFDVTSGNIPNVGWASDGQAIVYQVTRGGPSGVTNLWSQSLDGGPPKQITDFKSGTFSAWGWSRYGKWLAFGRGTRTADVVLIKDFR